MNTRANQRTDQYGGNLENRLLVVYEIITDVRRKAPGLVVGFRVSGHEFDTEGLSEEEVIAACEALSGALDYISVAGGISTTLGGAIHIVPPMAYAAGYLKSSGGAIKNRVTCPVMLTGRINSPQVAEQNISAGEADACGMTRAMICDPKISNKANAGAFDDIRACIGCNQACIGHFHKGYPISCIQHPETGRELRYGERRPAASARKILVVGGAAGMKAAAVAAERGHEVTLLESSPRLGGQALLAQLLPGRQEFGGIVTNLKREVELAGVNVTTSTQATPELIAAHKPHAVVIATGAIPFRPPLEGAQDAWQVLRGEVNVGVSVAIADWRCDWVGMGIAEKLARDGCSVRLFVNGHMAGENLPYYVRVQKIGDLHKLGVETVPMVKLFGADA